MKVFYSAWLKDFEKDPRLLAEARSSGFEGIELSLDYPACYRGDEVFKVFSRFLQEELTFGVHLPWRDIALSSPLEGVRSASVKEIVQCAKKIINFNPEYLVLHVSTDQAFCGYRNRDCLNSAIKSLKQVFNILKDKELTLEVETTSDRCCGDEESLPYLLHEFDPERVGVCLDVVHIIERRLRKWDELYSISEVIRDLAPILLERIHITHIHGYKISKTGMFRSHTKPTEEQVYELITSLQSLGILSRIKIAVIEVFYHGKTRVKPYDLRDVIRVIRSYGSN